MPADVEHLVTLGEGGLNLREQPAQLQPTELVDTLNWQLDQNGALIKRLGSISWGAQLLANVLELGKFWPSGANPTVLAHCDDGTIQASGDGSSWTQIDSGLSTTVPAGFVQYLDKVYWCDGTNAIRQWDGLTLTILPVVDADDVQTITITGTPTGGTFTLTLDGQTTSPLAFSASAGAVQAALEALTNIGTGNVLCSGGALPGSGVVCTFRAGMAFRPVDLMTSTDSFTGGTAPASHVAHTTPGTAIVPQGRLLTIFRNRLWVAIGRTVYWSKAGDPTDFTVKTNFVTFPDDTPITALIKAPNFVYHRVLYDGVLVFTQRRTHRIVDDSDNIAGVITGGQNVLVDSSQGCISQRSAVEMNGLIYMVGHDGVYSTNGYGPCEKQSLKIRPIFDSVGPSQEMTLAAMGWRGRYYLAYQPPGTARNTRLLELNLDLPASGGQQPWMAHTLPAQALLAVTPTDPPLFADASDGDGGYVRRAFSGGTDITGDSDITAFQARCRSGAQLLGASGKKHIRRVQVYGAGSVSLSVSSDFSTDLGDTQILDMAGQGEPTWDDVTWDEFQWGPLSDARSAVAYFQTRGRFFTFDLSEGGSATRVGPSALGYGGAEIGGAAIYAINVRIVPLDP